MRSAEEQYLEILSEIVHNGTWIDNKRTGSRCKTVIDRTIRFNAQTEFPILTTKKTYYRTAIGEMLGYLRGYDNINQFHKLNVHTWDANANAPVWLNSIYHSGKEGDLGLIYGACGNELFHIERGRVNPDSSYWIYPVSKIKWLDKLIEKIKNGDDDRGLIWNFWNPSLFHMGCLRPCMYEHQFSLLGDTLHLSSTQRSVDVPLGYCFNLIQCFFLLHVIATLTNKKVGNVVHRGINLHVYENQLSLAEEQLSREPYSPTAKLVCNKEITYESVFGLHSDDSLNLHPNDFEVVDYTHHPYIKYPFTV